MGLGVLCFTIGGPESVRRQIDELLAATEVNELMITTMTYDTADRWHSYDLVAELAGLTPPCRRD